MNLQNDFLQALLKEIAIRKDYAGREEVQTIYFGGGTPSLMRAADLQLVKEKLHEQLQISQTAEVTLEANPDDITPQALRNWRKAGINRLSIGVQSFFDDDLQWMNRAHNAAQATECIRWAREEGFSNLTIDLIYGTPTLSDEKWMQNLATAQLLGIPHLSCYALTVESKTALDMMIKKKTVPDVDQEVQARQFSMMTSFLASHGYQQYEISNFALPGKRSIHNSSYWSGAQYIGFGPSAHSFNGVSRQWNVANNALYIQSLANGLVPSELETLTTEQKFNEYVMTSLRTLEGTSLQHVEQAFGEEFMRKLQFEAKGFIDRQQMREEEGRLVLTEEGKLFADGIASELFADTVAV